MQTQSGLSTLRSQTRLSDQASNPCVDADYPFSQFLLHQVIGKEFEKSVQTVMERCNNNMPLTDVCFPLIVGKNCYRKNQVACIISAYTNRATKKEFPPYSPGTPNAQTIINVVREDTDQPFHQIKAVLDQLYYGVRDGSVKSAQLLYPVKYTNNKEILDTPQNVASGERDTQALFDNVKKYATYGLYGAVGLGVLYLGFQAYGAFKTVKGAA